LTYLNSAFSLKANGVELKWKLEDQLGKRKKKNNIFLKWNANLLKKRKRWLGMVVHACNSSYLGGRGRRTKV
jgi:hypothetical protein